MDMMELTKLILYVGTGFAAVQAIANSMRSHNWKPAAIRTALGFAMIALVHSPQVEAKLAMWETQAEQQTEQVEVKSETSTQVVDQGD